MTIDEKTFHAAVADFATAGLQRSDQPVMQLELEAMSTERGRLSFALAVLSEARNRMVGVTHTIRALGDVEPLEPQLLRPVHNLVGRHSDHLMAALRLLLLFERPDAPEPAVHVKMGGGAWKEHADDAGRREALYSRLAERNAPGWVQWAAGMIMDASCCSPVTVADHVSRWTDADLVRAREWAAAQDNAGFDPPPRAPKHVQDMIDAENLQHCGYCDPSFDCWLQPSKCREPGAPPAEAYNGTSRSTGWPREEIARTPDCPTVEATITALGKWAWGESYVRAAVAVHGWSNAERDAAVRWAHMVNSGHDKHAPLHVQRLLDAHKEPEPDQPADVWAPVALLDVLRHIAGEIDRCPACRSWEKKQRNDVERTWGRSTCDAAWHGSARPRLDRAALARAAKDAEQEGERRAALMREMTAWLRAVAGLDCIADRTHPDAPTNTSDCRCVICGVERFVDRLPT